MSGSSSAARMKRQGSIGIGMNDHASGSTGMSSRSSKSVADDHQDRGLVMKDKERFEDEGSIGKAGGVGVGVTRPKRRLSSLPSLPHPFLSAPANANGTSSFSHRAMSQSNASPPTSPTLGKINGSHPSSTYQALSNNLSSGSGATSSSNSYHMYRNQPVLRLDEKAGYSAAPVSAKSDGPPTILGIELKWISLVTLALQNAFLTIIMHYSRITAPPDRSYSAATAVLLNELMKGSISLYIALRKIDTDMSTSSNPAVYSEKDSRIRPSSRSTRLPTLFHSSRLRVLSKSIFSPDCYTLAVPAILYVIQNNLQYVAASNLDVATFQVTYQMKILTTAFFSVFILRKRLSRGKWFALILLAVGVGIVQIQTTSAPAPASTPPTGVKISHGEHALRSDIPAAPILGERTMNPFKGFMAVTAACLTSGLAGVYFEFILKGGGASGPAPDLWIRNTQLSLFSLVPALIPILVFPTGPAGAGWFERVIGSFSNFNGWAIGTVLTQTFGGLITAVVIRYSDNIMKGFATSISIVLSFLASVALFNYPITLAFCIGSSIVLLATYLYNAPAPTTPRTTIGVDPGSPISASAPILGEPKPPSRTASFANLLGIGSNPGSRKPSATDLRSQFGSSSSGFTQVSPNLSSGPVMGLYEHTPGSSYSASTSTNTSSSNIYEKR